MNLRILRPEVDLVRAAPRRLHCRLLTIWFTARTVIINTSRPAVVSGRAVPPAPLRSVGPPRQPPAGERLHGADVRPDVRVAPTGSHVSDFFTIASGYLVHFDREC